MITIVSKGNGRNFYGFKGKKILELVKEGGRFYEAKFSEKFGGLVAKGNPLKKFTIVN